MEDIHCLLNPDDPQFAEKVGAFFIALNRSNRARALRAPSVPPKSAEGCGRESVVLCPDNLPEKYVSREMYLEIMRLRQQMGAALDALHPETNDARLAAACVTQTAILMTARDFSTRFIHFLCFERLYHPNALRRGNALDVLGLDRDGAELCQTWKELLAFAASCNRLHADEPVNATMATAWGVLRTMGDAYFGLLQATFPSREAALCAQAFSAMMAQFGTWEVVDLAAGYAQRYKAMGCAIKKVYWATAEKKEPPNFTMPTEWVADVRRQTAMLEQIGAKVNEATTVVRRLDRRIAQLITNIRRWFAGFTKLFRPGQPVPTREKVAAAFADDPVSRALKNYRGIRRTILLAVIEDTRQHPVAYKPDRKTIARTLADAAAEVWNRDHAKWANDPEAYKTYEDLKSAVYHLAKNSSTNPFTYG